MNKVAKLIIVDSSDHYLLLLRNNHPLYGNDPDLPGGTLEFGEQPLQAMIREVEEEAGVTITAEQARWIYTGTDHSNDGTEYSLYIAFLTTQPAIIVSWEHISFEWLSRQDFLKKIQSCEDTYMQMTYDTLNKINPSRAD